MDCLLLIKKVNITQIANDYLCTFFINYYKQGLTKNWMKLENFILFTGYDGCNWSSIDFSEFFKSYDII